MAVRHYHHRYHFSYETSLRKHFSSIAIVTIILIALLALAFRFLAPNSIPFTIGQLSFADLGLASLATLSRIFIAYIVSVVVAIPVALLITGSERGEKILLPIFDVIQSVPVLAFFPVIVLVFLKFNFFWGAAIFILTVDMMWNIVFSLVGGLKSIPEDIKSASQVFGASKVKKLFFVTLPAIFPYLITGSLLAWGQAWNIIIVAEVLHTYIPGADTSADLLGLGSLLVNAASSGQDSVFLATLITMIVLIGSFNFFVWQKLIHLTERYRFD